MKIWEFATASVARTIISILVLLGVWIVLLNALIALQVPEGVRLMAWFVVLLVAVLLVRKIIVKLEKGEGS